ncbi:MAG: zinc/manganese transport system substrate-binding protein, partial [Abditibacteriota bacterium]|nr:zinc/manganese transport system substrate-binding protein [Abditibacteriota bacterium]
MTYQFRCIASLFSTFIALCALITPSFATVDVVTSIPELAAIAKEVGGEDVAVYAIARAGQDYHNIEPRPSDVARLTRAGLVVRSGLGLDSWLSALSNATGNAQVRPGGTRYVDASQGFAKIEVPETGLSGASGDVHSSGNPHYYYDPILAIHAARNILR